MSFFSRLLCFAVCLVLTPWTVSATDWLSSDASDPNLLGWMKGTPPPQDKIISIEKNNYFVFPQLRWSVCHMRELFPTKVIRRKTGGSATSLDYAPHREFASLHNNINALEFTPVGGGHAMSWRTSLDANYTDGLLILHKGRIVYEYYSGCLDEFGKHAIMSMTKSMVGLVAEILVAEGKLDPSKQVRHYVPALSGSGFSDATVRQVMDMTTAIAFDENYDNPKADIWQYSAAGSPFPKGPDYKGPVGYLAYLKTVKKQGRHGKQFGYKTVNTDVLAWIISSVTEKAFSEVLSEKVWQPMGAEQDAYISVDATGHPFAGGGMVAGLRDLGRVGQLMLNHGKAGEKQVLPEAAVTSIEKGGSKPAFGAAGFSTMPGGSYRSMWWHFHNENGAYAARGVHGQTIYIDPTANMVLVRLSSYPTAKNAKIDPTSLPAYQAVADYLMRR